MSALPSGVLLAEKSPTQPGELKKPRASATEGLSSDTSRAETAIVQQDAKSQAADQSELRQSVMFESLAQMNKLIALGVPSLALSLLDEEQNKYRQFSPDWYSFEYKRILSLIHI